MWWRLAALLFCTRALLAAEILTACSSHFPPFVLADGESSQRGYTVELLTFIAPTLKREARIMIRPWNRCLRDVEEGKTDLAVDAFYTDERAEKFFYSDPYFVLRPQLFFSRRRFPQGLSVQSVEQLRGLSGCGVAGYSYQHYQFDEAHLDLGAKNLRDLFRKLIAERCDFVLEELQAIRGQRQFSHDWPDDADIDNTDLPFAQNPSLHFLIGKKQPFAEQLIKEINAGIAWANQDSRIEALKIQYRLK